VLRGRDLCRSLRLGIEGLTWVIAFLGMLRLIRGLNDGGWRLGGRDDYCRGYCRGRRSRGCRCYCCWEREEGGRSRIEDRRERLGGVSRFGGGTWRASKGGRRRVLIKAGGKDCQPATRLVILRFQDRISGIGLGLNDILSI